MENMEMRYYKILQGFEHERDITIREDELEKAYGLFMLGGRGIFSGGAVDGKYIQTIVEDYHATMGWNNEHKLDVDDYAQMRSLGIDKQMKDILVFNKDRVQYLIDNKQENLIGENLVKFESRKQLKERSEGMKSIGEMNTRFTN